MTIRVKFEHVKVARLTPEVWETALFNTLREAGIPVNPDGSVPGALKRWDDPEDFGATWYEWIAPEELYMPAETVDDAC